MFQIVFLGFVQWRWYRPHSDTNVSTANAISRPENATPPSVDVTTRAVSVVAEDNPWANDVTTCPVHFRHQ